MMRPDGTPSSALTDMRNDEIGWLTTRPVKFIDNGTGHLARRFSAIPTVGMRMLDDHAVII